jgi:peptidoglycan/xylan/chitin deacetylase (PgdA/CDA1 family)
MQKEIFRLLCICISASVYVYDAVRKLILQACRLAPAGYCVILYYHSIRQEDAKKFSRQMEVLSRLTSPIALPFSKSFEPGCACAAVTFDDALLSVYTIAWPELRKRRIPFCVFVPTGYLGQPPLWSQLGLFPGERIMTEAELLQLADDELASIGSHSVSHPDMSRLAMDRVIEELVQSKESLESMLGHEIAMFSFPYGEYNRRILAEAIATGYRQIYTIEPQKIVSLPDTPVIGRVSVDLQDTMIEFRLKLAGATRWRAKAAALKNKFRRTAR